MTDSDPLFARIAESFARQAFMSTLGAKLATVSSGQVRLELPFSAALTQQHGYLHAGVVASIADSACGYAALSIMPDDSSVLSVEFKVNMLAPALGDRFVATGKVVRAGRTLIITQGEVLAITGAGPQPILLMQATMMRVDAQRGKTG
jgi:uncharacterized protein (TIGR00369 family)